MEDPLECCSGAGSKGIRFNQISDMCIRVLVAQDRLDWAKSFQSARMRELVE